jgi:hypothetical protein
VPWAPAAAQVSSRGPETELRPTKLRMSMVVSAGWSVPVGRGPTGGRTVDRSARGTAGVEG